MVPLTFRVEPPSSTKLVEIYLKMCLEEWFPKCFQSSDVANEEMQHCKNITSCVTLFLIF